METKFTDRVSFYAYLDKTGAVYTVDNNPSDERLSMIDRAIARKQQLIQRAKDLFNSQNGITVSL